MWNYHITVDISISLMTLSIAKNQLRDRGRNSLKLGIQIDLNLIRLSCLQGCSYMISYIQYNIIIHALLSIINSYLNTENFINILMSIFSLWRRFHLPFFSCLLRCHQNLCTSWAKEHKGAVTGNKRRIRVIRHFLFPLSLCIYLQCLFLLTFLIYFLRINWKLTVEWESPDKFEFQIEFMLA